MNKPAQLDQTIIEQRLAQTTFADENAARMCIKRISAHEAVKPFAGTLLPVLLNALIEAASPDRALVSFERFFDAHDEQDELFRKLANEPRLIEMLVTLFAGSEFLGQILLRHPEYFEHIRDRKRLAQPKNQHQFYGELLKILEDAGSYDESLDFIRRYQRLQLLRIGASDLFDLVDFPTVIEQLSLLANGIIQTCLDVSAKRLEMSWEGFAVFALGKLGGRELNYSSDIDLVFISEKKDQRYIRLGQSLIEALQKATPEGFLYRVDMRLRPWGRASNLVPTLDEYLSYLDKHARNWEKQALSKSRFVAGDEKLGIKFRQEYKNSVFSIPAEELQAEIQRMKGEIEAKLLKAGQEWGEVKGGKGSIRDIEFITQYLQLTNGAEHPEIRSRNTIDGLARMAASGILSLRDYRVLSDSYVFLRTVEHHLQIMHNRQMHTLPADKRELAYLAKRLGFTGADAGQNFVKRYEEHRAAVRTAYLRTFAPGSPELESEPPLPDDEPAAVPMDAIVLSKEQKELQKRMAERLNDDNLIELEVKPLDSKNEWLLTLVGYDYTGELSLICGLLFVYGLNIEDGFLLTEEFKEAASKSSRQTRKLNFRQRRRIAQTLRTKKTNRRIADVFRVSAARKKLNPDMWPEYERELRGYIEQLRDKKHQEVQAHLAKRVALAIRSAETGPKTLLPVEIDIDNGASEEFTVLRINAADTIGFLYELSNALSLNGIHISRVHISSLGRRIHDTLFVTDLHGNKIVAPEKQQQLRAAVVLVKHFTHILPQLPNPESALMHFREFVSQLFTRESWTSELASIERPEVLNSLAKLLGASDFLWQDFLRMQHGNLFPVVENLGALGVAKSKEQLHKQMLHELSACTDFVQRREVLNTFKDREMFRIDMRYIQRIIPEFWLFSVELTHLGEIVLETAFQICYEKLREELGEPRTNDGNLCAICMCGLGKFGGREIGFASDIELMILYEGQGETVGGKVSSTTSEFVEKLIREILQAIKAKREGIFELDLRLRPYGKGSPLGVSYDSFERYFHPDGPAWNFERQALVRLRPIAGDLTFGAKIERLRDSYVYNGTRFDIAAMRAMREKQVLQLVQGGSINAKFSAGALVDIEYLVQGLQIMHGHDKPELRQPNTGASLASLLRIGFISTEDYVTLQQALDFLRRLIQGLRIVRGNAKDLTVPDVDSDQFAFLARRLGYEADVKKLQEDIQRQMANVRDVSRKLLG